MSAKKILKYPEDAMMAAIAAVRDGMQVKTAAKKFSVPRTTLLYKVRGKNPEGRKMGPETIFTKEEEHLLEEWVHTAAKAGMPVSKEYFLQNVAKLAKELNKKFKNDKPGRKWYKNFLARHPKISLRTPQNLTKSRASVTLNNLKSWFKEVEDYLTEIGSSFILREPARIFNADESAFFLNPKGSKVLASKGEKTVYSHVNSNEKECITVLFTGNAAGQLAPPLVILKYKRVPSEIAESVPKNWGIGTSDTGWMTSDTFYCYMSNVFIPWAKENIQFPIVFFVDGHSSHLSYHVSKLCTDNKIIFKALYPNATHLLQPMDVAVFRTLKSSWRESVQAWRIENQNEMFKKKYFSKLLAKVMEETVTPKILQNGFKKCGLFPWNPETVNSFFPEATTLSLVTQNTSTPTTKIISELKYFENFIEKDTLTLFKSHPPDQDWTGKEFDKSLYETWKKMANTEMNSDAVETALTLPDVEIENLENLIQEAELLFIDDINILNSNKNNSSTLNLSLQVESDLNTKLKEKETHVDLLPNANEHSRTIKNNVKIGKKELLSPKHCLHNDGLIPSPFKRVLFWPEPKKDVPKRKKEKIPSVITSEQWQEYNKKKANKKKIEEELKLEKKKKREEKKNENNIKKNKLIKLNNTNSEKNEEKENVFLQNSLQIKVQDFVIVKYENKYFPGQVKDIREVEEEMEYLVTTMAQSGPAGWRWPEKKDEIWYAKGDVLEAITPPCSTNSRGMCIVKELEKYTLKN